MITLSGITRVYALGEERVRALKGINLEINRGDYVAIMGPSGSGKSTLLNVLGCLDRPTTGSYTFEGEDVARLSDDQLSELRRKKIGFVFQSFHLIPRMSAARNVELPMIFAGLDRAERKRRIHDELSQVGLAHRGEHRPSELSGGERQRVAIARSLVMEPSILLADEPTGNLDQKTGAEIVELMEKLNREGITLVMVTHNPDLGARARRTLHLVDGEIDSDIRR